MNIAQVVIMGYTFVAVGCLGDSLKHRGQGHPLHWWVYGVMVVVFLVDYWVAGRI